MKLPILPDSCVLPISDQLIQMLGHELNTAHPSINPLLDLSAITFNFRDPDYSAELGGYHPVEIRISRQASRFIVDYITDFSYVGSGWDVELAKELDFDCQYGFLEMRYAKPTSLALVGRFYRTFEGNFLSYYQMGIFNVEITLEEADA